MEMQLTKRQKQVLKVIIDEYTETALPVGSQVLITKYLPDLSSATIRNEMVILENYGYIIKYYASSGRIPTLAGYQFYNNNLMNDIPVIFKQKLKDLLAKRNLSIDEIVDKSVEIINEITNLPTVLTEFYHHDLLRKIELVSISDKLCLFLIITSSGQIIKQEIVINNQKLVDDLIICVSIFNDRLIDTPLGEINQKLDLLKVLIREKIKGYEFVIQEVVEKIFKNIDWSKTKIKNSKEITIHPEFSDLKKFQRIMGLLNDVSVWKHIAYQHSKSGQKNISFKNDIGVDDSSITSTSIELNDASREISVIGPNRMNYAKVNTLLKVLKEELEKLYKNDNE